jgi:hypothetical protein
VDSRIKGVGIGRSPQKVAIPIIEDQKTIHKRVGMTISPAQIGHIEIDKTTFEQVVSSSGLFDEFARQVQATLLYVVYFFIFFFEIC